LEYFCACEFVERFGKRGIEGGLTLEELKTEVFGKHWQDKSWHEVMRLIVGLIDTSFAGEIIDYLIVINGQEQKFTNLFLAAECLSEVRNRSHIEITVKQLLEQLKELSTYVEVIKKFEHSSSHSYGLSGNTISVIATTWKDDPDTLPWLKSLAQSDEDKRRRRAAVEALAQGWKDDPDTLPLLKSLAQSDEDEWVRRAAVEALAQGWKDDSDTLLIIKSCAQSGEDWRVRQAAVQALAQGWKDDSDTLLIIKSCAQSGEISDVRQVAVEALAQGWKDDSDTLLIIKSCAQLDDSNYVRSAAMRELTRGWKDEPWLFEFLCDRALNDPFERKEDRADNPRQLALEIIIKQYRDRPQTLPLLQDRAENDPDDKVREFAREKLEQLERQN
jgi:hypothetical protein